MPLHMIREDITRMAVDAIVAAGSDAPGTPRPTGGVNGSIHKKAGARLLDALRRLGGIRPGKATLTPAFDLPCRYVIHTAGPRWQGGNRGEEAHLRACYENALALAAREGFTSIAFPLISTGKYGYPKAEALRVASGVIRDFLQEHDMQVYLVAYDRETFQASTDLFRDVQTFVDQHYVDEHHMVRQRAEEDWARRRADAADDAARPSGNILQKLSDPEKAKTPPPAPSKDEADAYAVMLEEQRRLEELIMGVSAPPERAVPPETEKAAADMLLAESPEDAVRPVLTPGSSASIDAPPPKPAPSAPRPAPCGASAPRPVPSAPPPAKPAAMPVPKAAPPVPKPAPRPAPAAGGMPDDLERRLRQLDMGFSDMLLHLIDEKGMKDAECYHRANVDRKLFSKIRSNPDYKPKKPTAVALCVALQLDWPQTCELLSRAGYAMSRSSKFDVIVEYFINQRKFDVYEINLALWHYDQPLLGSEKGA